MNEKWYSVKEFSALAHVSNKAIYQQLDGRLKEYVRIIDGKRKISSQALEKYYDFQVSSQVSSQALTSECIIKSENSSQVSSQVSSENSSEIVRLELEKKSIENDLLRERINDKEKEIAFLQSEIKELQERLKESHTTQALLENKLLSIEEVKENEHQEKKKSWGIFKKKN